MQKLVNYRLKIKKKSKADDGHHMAVFDSRFYSSIIQNPNKK